MKMKGPQPLYQVNCAAARGTQQIPVPYRGSDLNKAVSMHSKVLCSGHCQQCLNHRQLHPRVTAISTEAYHLYNLHCRQQLSFPNGINIYARILQLDLLGNCRRVHKLLPYELQ